MFNNLANYGNTDLYTCNISLGFIRIMCEK